MEVAIPASPPHPAAEFNFDSNCSSPYMTAPSSPQRFPNFFFSAPASPSRPPSALYDGAAAARNSASSAVPFDWGERESPRSPKNRATQKDEIDFQFDFSGNLGEISLSAADELFAGGKIRPLKPPTATVASGGSGSSVSSPRPKKSLFPLSPRRRRSSAAAEIGGADRIQKSKMRGASRSLSPIRVSDIILEQDDDEIEEGVSSNTSRARQKPAVSSSIASIFAGKYRKWKLRDLLLFRSASEGRATGKEVIGKYAASPEELRNSSFRSPEATVGSSSRRRGPAMSAHEVHYTANRAAAEEMRRKTMLPYKQGLLGCLGLNQEISRGIGSLTRGRS